MNVQAVRQGDAQNCTKRLQREGKEHQRNTKGTPKEHQRIWLETSEILRQGVEAAICVKPLSQVDPKDLKLLGVGALVVPLLQPAAACCSLPVT